MSKVVVSLGIDAGNGAFKLFGSTGGLELLSHVAVNTGQKVHTSPGLRKARTPLSIRNEHGEFYVGTGAHDFGRPIENLDVDRFNGSPEMKALLHGSLTCYQQRYGKFDAALSVVVGLPNEVLSGEVAEQNIDNVKGWLRGQHVWQADGIAYQLEICEVKAASQVTGGLFDYLLDAEGCFIPERKAAFNGEVGVITIGFGTVELMVVRNRVMVQRYTSGSASGVRRLLEIVNSQRLYSLGELDLQLRAGYINTRDALPIWEREVTGVIEKQWGSAWKRFSTILIMGGGAILLRDSLPLKFQGRACVPDDPVLAIARGLYRLSIFQQARRGI